MEKGYKPLQKPYDILLEEHSKKCSSFIYNT